MRWLVWYKKSEEMSGFVSITCCYRYGYLLFSCWQSHNTCTDTIHFSVTLTTESCLLRSIMIWTWQRSSRNDPAIVTHAALGFNLMCIKTTFKRTRCYFLKIFLWIIKELSLRCQLRTALLATGNPQESLLHYRNLIYLRRRETWWKINCYLFAWWSMSGAPWWHILF